jgi:hypothetical protein
MINPKTTNAIDGNVTNGDGNLTIFGIRVGAIAFLVNKVGLPSLVVVTVLGGALWYGPKYLERQNVAMEAMATAFKDVAEVETEVKMMVAEIKDACKETRQFQHTVVDDHKAAKEERTQMLNDHKVIMAELIGKTR